MIGPYVNLAAIILGSLIGITLKKRIPKSVTLGLPDIFSLLTIGVGVLLLCKTQNLVIVSLAIIIGYFTGEILKLEKSVSACSNYLQLKISTFTDVKSEISRDEYSRLYSNLVVLFCTGATGIIGALTEGMTGDYNLLLIKSLIDFFSAMTFCIILGIPVLFICLPLFIIETTLYFAASLLMPVMNEAILNDFMGCGGLIMIGVGINIAKIKQYPTLATTPALILVVIFSKYLSPM